MLSSRAAIVPDPPREARPAFSAPSEFTRRPSGSPTRSHLPSASGVVATSPSPASRRDSDPPRSVSRTTPIPRSALDPWEPLNVAPSSPQDQIALLTSALHVTLALLAESRPDDPVLAETRRTVATLQARAAVQEAREHEARERWLHASQSWMRAARACPDDAWLLAHAARTLLQTNASSQDAAEAARRALALDPANSLAAMVLLRAVG